MGFRVLAAAGLCASASMVPFVQAYAQGVGSVDGSTQASGVDGADDRLDEIVVTAERRTEDGQRVPAAIQQISGAALAKAGYTSVTDLQYLAPGVQYDPTNGAAFQIRGVGSQSFDTSNAKSVSVVVDDVVMDGQRANGLIGLIDIANVDVLMGPQGTLFGMNSTSGVIAVTTNKPQLGVYSMRTSLNYGERNDRIVNATVNLPLGDRAAFRVTGFNNAQDGFGRNVTLKKDVGAVDEWGGRARLYVEPSDRFDLLVSADYGHHWDSSVRTPAGGQPAALQAILNELGVQPGEKSADTADSQRGFIETTEWGGSLRLNAKLGDHVLSSITAYRETEYRNSTPIGFVPLDRFTYVPFNLGHLTSNKVSQEVHLASPTGGFVEYLVGVFYNRLEATQRQYQWGTLGTPLSVANGTPAQLFAISGAIGESGNTQRFDSTNESIAAFGQVKLNLTPQASIAVGGRYTHDNNSQGLSFYTTDPLPIVGYTPVFAATSTAPVQPFGRAKGDNFSVRVSPQYQLSDQAMVYFTFATGYKPGGVAFLGNRYNPYAKETVKSYEAGIKTEWFGRRLRFNLDVFRSDFDDFQASVLTTLPGVELPTVAIGNAGGLRSQGVEAMIAAKPMRGLSISGSATYTDAKFTDYQYNATTDYTGTRLSNAPEFAANAAVDYESELGTSGLALRAHADYAYRSQVWTAVGEPDYTRVPGFSLVNARLSLLPRDGQIEVGVYARNLFDQHFSTGYQYSAAFGYIHYTSPSARRTVGGFLNFNF
jgi:iron complex outermembrane receptor protein